MKKSDKISLLKAMHKAIIEIGDESLYIPWVTCGVPDEPSEDDFEFIASDKQEFEDCLGWFTECIKRYEG